MTMGAQAVRNVFHRLFGGRSREKERMMREAIARYIEYQRQIKVRHTLNINGQTLQVEGLDLAGVQITSRDKAKEVITVRTTITVDGVLYQIQAHGTEYTFTAEDAPGLPGVSGAVPAQGHMPQAGGGAVWSSADRALDRTAPRGWRGEATRSRPLTSFET
jgi:hypothetical protein